MGLQNQHHNSVYGRHGSSIHPKYSFGWFSTAALGLHQLYEEKNNSSDNTCQLHIIIAEKATLLTFQNLWYNAVPLPKRM